jgi:hypothetical protein
MIVDVTLFLDLADHRTAAGMAGDQPGEGKVMLAALGLPGEAAIKYALHAFPKLDRHERLVLPLNELAVPFEPAGIEPVAQDRVHCAGGNRCSALLVSEAGGAGLLGHFLQRILTGRVPVEQLRDDGRDLRIDRDYFRPSEPVTFK